MDCKNFNESETLVPSKVKSESKLNKLKSEQVIIAFIRDSKSFKGILLGIELINNNWEITFDSIPCTFGKNGVALNDQKIEGDKKTPSGTFQLGPAFGYKDNLGSKMNFIELSQTHYWVSDSKSKLYNRLIDYLPKGIYAEKMRRPDHLYKYGIIIEYNTSNVIKGKGSAIFIHIERNPGAPTTGCIAVSEENIIQLIKWINPHKNSSITIDHLNNIPILKSIL